jgi:HPt (histidine-containing phosphotransfer) domain-containing protein
MIRRAEMAMKKFDILVIDDKQQNRLLTASDGVPEALVELLEAVAGDRGIAIRLVGEFLASYRVSLDGISAAVSAGRAGEVERRAHQFKGCLGVFCRTEPLELTQRLIDLAEGNSIAEAPQTLNQLEIEMEKLVAGLTDFVAR